jgi:hypothetical protein
VSPREAFEERKPFGVWDEPGTHFSLLGESLHELCEKSLM